MLDQTTDSQPLATPPSTSNGKAVVVGLYGVPGSGKTTLLNWLKQELGHDCFTFYDGSKVIDDVVPGKLEAFQKFEEKEKEHWRQIAIDKIGRECTENRKTGIVAGHFMFWPEEEDVGHTVCTAHDLCTFTHILYLDVPAGDIAQRRQNDVDRVRPNTSINHLSKWQQAEKTELRRLCREKGILFSLLSLPESGTTVQQKASKLIRDFQRHNEEYNLSCAERKLDEVLAGQGQLETVLVMDADRTLASVDTGKLFWARHSKIEEDPLKMLFSSPLGYSYTAFRQAALLYEETANEDEFDTLCQDVASEVTLYPEFASLLHRVAKQQHISAVVVTCGLRRVWEQVLKRAGLSETVSVLGGGRIVDGFVVNAALKASLVGRLQDLHHIYVWAFGDSPLDLEMLRKADKAVVAGEEESSSKTMDASLVEAISNGLQAHQAVLPSNAAPRLDTTTLPLIQLREPEFVNSVLCRRRLQVFHATERNAAKLLMTPMRDARFSGPTLREAHRRAGWYLAIEFLADIIGVEECQIPHVQGGTTSGHRLLREQQTSIVALMRGGEPMALGVNEVFPFTIFVHASRPDDVKPHHVLEQGTVVLVDSVVNSGKSVVQFVRHIRSLHPTIHIVVVAGVVQAQSVFGGSLEELGCCGNLSLVALRLSGNKFTGSGTTDTGNRLFNTTYLA